MKRIALFSGLGALALALTGNLFAQSRGLRDPGFLASLNVPAAAATGISAPTEISGCTLWLAADQSEFSAYNDGDSVATWTDHSSNGFNITAGTAAIYTNNAINSKPSIIVANDTRLNSASLAVTNFVGTNTFTVFYAAALQPGVDTQYLWYWYDAADNAFRCRFVNGSLSFEHASTGGEGVSTVSFGTMTNNQFRLYEFSKSGTDNLYMITNGVTLLNDNSVNASLNNAGNAQTMRIPGTTSLSMVGQVLEIVMFNRFLDSSETTQMRNYFTSKYGAFPW